MEPDQLYKEARRKALRALTYRGRSAAELTAYLKDKGYDEKIADRVVEEMISLHYVDDPSLARDLVEQRLRRGYGPVRIRLEMKQKGFDKNLIEKLLILHYPQDMEYNLAAVLLEKKEEREGSPEGPRQIYRWANFLRRRGFSEQAVARAVKKYLNT